MFRYCQDLFQHHYEEYQFRNLRESLAYSIMRSEYRGDCCAGLFEGIAKVYSEAPVNVTQLNYNSEFERINMVWKMFPDSRLLAMLYVQYKCFAKDERFTKMFKKKADKYLKVNSLEAIECYNLALSFAPRGFQELGEIYGNRGCLALKLFELNDFLVDTSTALRLGCSKGLKKTIRDAKKADKRLFQSLVAKNQSQNGNWDYLGFRDNELFSIRGSVNPEYPAMASYLQVMSSDAYGKVVIVTDHVPAGTTVIVEEPYVAICADEPPLMWRFDYCCRCYKSLTSTIPCSGCVFSVYCSEECKTEDLKHGHKYFCLCSPYLHSVALSTSNEFYLAFKSLCKAGPGTLYEMYLTSTEMDENKNTAAATSVSGHGDLSVYKKVLNFEADTKLKASTIGSVALQCVSLIKVLDLKTPFFKQVKPADPEKFKKFVTFVLLNHTATASSNALLWHSREKSHVAEDTLGSPPKNLTPRGLGLFPSTVLLAHSCDPTATRLHLMNGRVAIVTNRRLYPGDEITISFAFEFYHMAKDKRENSLKPFRSSSCECLPCEKDWSVYTREMKHTTHYICQRCTRGQFKNYDRDMVSDAWKYLMISTPKKGVLVCRECGESLTLVEIQGKYWRDMLHAQELIRLNKPLDAIRILLECMEYFQKVLYPPSHECIQCMALLNEAYNRVLLEEDQ